MTTKTLIILMGVLCCVSCSNDISVSVDKISKSSTFDYELVGFIPRKSEVYESFEKIKNTASDDELLNLLHHESDIVKCYAYAGLTEREVDLLDHLTTNLKHSTQIKVRDMDLVYYTTTSSIMVQFTYPQLNRSDSIRLDSMILFMECDEVLKNEALLSMRPIPSWYDQVRKIAVSGQNPHALVSLAKYKREEDLGLLRENIDKWSEVELSLLIMKEFTSMAFFPNLIKIQSRELDKISGYDYNVINLLYEVSTKYGEDASGIFNNVLEDASNKESKYYNTYQTHLMCIICAVKGNSKEFSVDILKRAMNVVKSKAFLDMSFCPDDRVP